MDLHPNNNLFNHHPHFRWRNKRKSPHKSTSLPIRNNNNMLTINNNRTISIILLHLVPIPTTNTHPDNSPKHHNNSLRGLILINL